MDAREFTGVLKEMVQHAFAEYSQDNNPDSMGTVRTLEEAGLQTTRQGLFIKVGAHEFELSVTCVSMGAKFKPNDEVEVRFDDTSETWFPAKVLRVSKAAYWVQLATDTRLGQFSGQQGSVLIANARPLGGGAPLPQATPPEEVKIATMPQALQAAVQQAPQPPQQPVGPQGPQAVQGEYTRPEDPMEQLAKSYGFTNRAELDNMVTMIDMSTAEKLQAFNVWRENDGSKAGLVKLLT
jgi:hypothetical protein